MSRIAPSDVAYVAALARLALEPEEASGLAAHLEKILDHVASLDGVETEGVPPTLHGFDLPTPSRPDQPAAPLDPELAVANAPASEGSAFLVPKVLEEEN